MNLLATLLDHEPAPVSDWWTQIRSDHRSVLERQGLPGRRQENWKYTSLRRLEQSFSLPPSEKPSAVAPSPLPGWDGTQAVFVDGQTADDGPSDQAQSLAGLASDLPRDMKALLEQAFSGPDEGFAALNSALADDGLLLRVPAGEQRAVDLLSLHSGAARATHLRHLIVLEPDAQLLLVDRGETPAGMEGLLNQVMQVLVGPGGHVKHLRIPAASPGVSVVHRSDVSVARGGRYESITLDRGGALIRHDQNITLLGEGAHASLAGVYALAEESHVDNHCLVHHQGPGASSSQWFKGVLAGRSRAVFNGKVLVAAGADGTDAQQSNATLLLSPDAEVDTKPELEIYADDVKCAHGATVGELSDDELFYLRSRGIAEADARRLLVAGFCREVLQDADERVGAFLIAALDSHLEGELEQ